VSDRLIEAAGAAASAGEGPCVVLGSGPAAERLRSRVETAGADAQAPPGVVVETTGTVEGLQEALAMVRDLGTVVLAGPAPAEGAVIDLYADLHLRGLTVIGVPDDDVDRA